MAPHSRMFLFGIRFEPSRAAVVACRAVGVRLMENYAFLYHPQHEAARALVPKIGGARRFRAEFMYPFPLKGDIRLQPELGGGVFLDSFGYLIAPALFFFREKPEKVACVQKYDKKSGIDSAAEITINFPGSDFAEGRVAMDEEYISRYTLFGPRGTIQVLRAFSVDAGKTTELALEAGGVVEKITVKSASQFQLALEDFCKALRGKAVRFFEDDLLARAAVLEAARRSAGRGGERIVLSEIMRR